MLNLLLICSILFGHKWNCLFFWRNDSILLFLRIDNHSSVMSLKVVRHFYRCENCLRYQIFPLFPHPLPDNNVLWAADLDGLLGQCQQAWTSGYSWLCLDHGALRDLSNPFLRVVSRLQDFVGLAPILAPIPSDTMPLVTDLGFWLIGRHICLSVRSAGHLFLFFLFVSRAAGLLIQDITLPSCRSRIHVSVGLADFVMGRETILMGAQGLQLYWIALVWINEKYLFELLAL